MTDTLYPAIAVACLATLVIALLAVIFIRPRTSASALYMRG